MGATFSICGTCNAETTFNNKEEEKKHKENNEAMIKELIKVKMEQMLIRTEYIEKKLDETKDELKETKTYLREDIKEMKNDLLMLIKYVNK